MSQDNFAGIVATAVAAAHCLAGEPNVKPADAEALALRTLQRYATRAGIEVQIDAVSLATQPPTVYLRIPEGEDVDEYCAGAKDRFGDAVLLESSGP
jgi:hypothetical protein